MKSAATLPVSISRYEQKIKDVFATAGITVNGNDRYDIQVNDSRFYSKILANGSVGLGESYMDGWWTCAHLDEFFTRIIDGGLAKLANPDPGTKLISLEAKFLNFQNIRKAINNASAHYNIGNDLFIAMLDKRMTYTCAYWKAATTLDEAQEAKLDLVCRKLYLEPGMNVLDIGCGWGSFARFAAENYNVQVTAVNVSTEQVKLGEELCRDLPVEFKLQDYRLIEGKYDRIVSLGMFEHVGLKNYRTFFKVLTNCLKDNGLALLHTIGAAVSSKHSDPWISKYIFPNCLIPSLTQIAKATEDLLVIEDVHNFGTDYDKTLMAWYQNFTANWTDLKANYSERFYRMWSYYLLCCAGAFRSRQNQLWQIVLSKGIKNGYLPLR